MTHLKLLLAALLVSACVPVYWGAEHSPRHVRIVSELRVSSDFTPAERAEIQAARDAWAEAGFPLPVAITSPRAANVLKGEPRLLSEQGSVVWVGLSEPILTLSPITLDLRVVALHEIGHALAGDGRHHRGWGVMSRRPSSTSITGDDIQVVIEAQHANW